ncbi:MAG: hypothetical protein P4L84_09925 [Isosphaeraceae bacterium]|nr:hypothetical protein [Isosphaeraceae bacterium]
MISIVKPDQACSRHNLTVQCPCGRTLRARIELAGSEIECWDCHCKVLVPFPRSASEVLRALRKGWDDVFETNLFPMLIGVAAVLTSMLAIPTLGVPLGIAGMVLVIIGYGVLIRRAEDPEGDSSTEAPDGTSLLHWLARGAASALFGVGLCAPFLLARGGAGHTARLAGFLVPAIVTAVMVFLPLAMLAAFDPAGPRVVPAVLRWRSRSVLLSLAILPLLLVVLECTLVFTTFFLGIFGGLMLDLVPVPPGLLSRLRVPPDWIYRFGEPADISFLGLYLNRLSHGYTLVGAIPPSLTRSTHFELQFWASNTEIPTYYAFRFALTVLINTFLLSVLALQASWLGRIGRIEGRLKVKPVPVAAEPSPAA